jgi:hypothetical protein
MEVDASADRAERWARSRVQISGGCDHRRVGRLDDAITCFRRAHDLGVDSIRLHTSAHAWLARAYAQKADWREVYLNAMFAMFAVIVTPLRNLRGQRPQGFTTT